MTADTSPTPNCKEAVSQGIFTSNLVWLIIAAGGLTAFFWDGIISLLDAWSRPEYSHGPIIPLIAGFLLLREFRDRPLVKDVGNRIPGFVLLLIGLFVGIWLP